VLQGHLLTSFRIQKCDGPWIASGPVVLTAVLYALWGFFLRMPEISLMQVLPEGLGGSLPSVGALLFGVAAGVARERSESIAAPILLHWICVAVVVLGAPLWEQAHLYI
jgi:membrane protease YdiL (CAAX protease family)